MARNSLLASFFAYFGTWFAQQQAQAPQPQTIPSIATPEPEPEPEPVQVVRVHTIGERGATPRHYRAFSLLAVRCEDVAMRDAMVAFRNRAKLIKLEDDEQVRNEALRVMDHFAFVMDRYAPLHDDTSGDVRVDKAAKMLVTMRRMDDALDAILSSSSTSADGFESAVRFIEIAYDPAAAIAEDYGLTSIA
jgi:hypothetical protein